MRLLVTGGAGFIGSNFVRYWVEQHPEDHVVVYDVLTYAGNRPNLSDVEDRIVFVQGDICDPDAAEKTLRGDEIDTIVHFAAESHNRLAVLDPGLFFRTNVLGTQTMLEAARQAGVARFHHISTCEVYGDLPLDTDEVFTEDSPYRPRTPYNASKAGADHAVRAYAETYGLPVTITNCCQQLRPVPVPREGDPALLRAGPRRPAAAALRQHPEPPGVAARRRPLHGHRGRARARGRVGETYHVGSGVEATIEEIADAVLAALGKPESLKKIVPDRPGHDRRYLLDSSKIRRELGWAPVGRLGAGPGRHGALVRRRTGTGGSRCGTGPRWSRAPGATGAGRRLSRVRILVTGADGQLGPRPASTPWPGGCPPAGAACALLGPEGPRPGLDHEVLAHRHRHHAASTTGTPCCTPFAAFRPDLVLHGGALTAVDRCETEADPAFAVNAIGTRHVAEAAALVGAHLVYVSTDYVFDGTADRPYREWDPPVPDVGLRRAPSWRASASAGPGRPSCAPLGVRRPRRQHGRAPCCAWPTGDGALRFVDDQHGSPDLHRRPGAGDRDRSASTAARASST